MLSAVLDDLFTIRGGEEGKWKRRGLCCYKNICKQDTFLMGQRACEDEKNGKNRTKSAI